MDTLFETLRKDFYAGKVSVEQAMEALQEKMHYDEFDANETVTDWADDAEDRGYELKESEGAYVIVEDDDGFTMGTSDELDPPYYMRGDFKAVSKEYDALKTSGRTVKMMESGDAEPLNEMETAGIASAFAPENVRAVVGAPSTLQARIVERKLRNMKLKENLEYHDQEWTNDMEKDEPSAYEEWRADLNEKNKESRREEDDADFERESGNKTHQINRDSAWTLNRQEDEFLNWFYNAEDEKEEGDDPTDDYDETDWGEFEDVAEYSTKLSEELKKPPLMTRLLINQHITNDDNLYTVGTTPNLDEFIDECLADGLKPKEIAKEVWADKYYQKSFSKTGTTEEDVATYIFRRSQKFKGKGGGEGGQMILDFDE